jgi:hypothetical protein
MVVRNRSAATLSCRFQARNATAGPDYWVQKTLMRRADGKVPLTHQQRARRFTPHQLDLVFEEDNEFHYTVALAFDNQRGAWSRRKRLAASRIGGSQDQHPCASLPAFTQWGSGIFGVRIRLLRQPVSRPICDPLRGEDLSPLSAARLARLGIASTTTAFFAPLGIKMEIPA